MRFMYYCVLCCCVWWNTLAYSMKNIRIGLGEPNSELSSYWINEDKWFVQRLDHFKNADNRTWNQRYQVNSYYYNKTNGPVFLLIAGESSMSSSWIYSGDWIEYAEEHNALCIQLEHRFYGKSRPTENMSTENLVYLNSEQALADAANFIANIKAEYEIPSTTKWVAFGGSYAGSLVAWLRMKYPHLVHAAVSSSGPLLAKLDFKEYFEAVADEINAYNPKCVSQIKQANKKINYLLKTKRGPKIIERKFKLCDSLDRHNKKDISSMFEGLANNFAETVQYSKDNRYYENPGELTLKTLCDIMLNQSLPTSLDRYAAVNNKLLSFHYLKCLNHNYTKILNDYLDTSWNNRSFGDRQWMYQTCTEFGFYQTSSQENHVFGHNFPIKFFIDSCIDIFGTSYDSELLSKAVQKTNNVYGALNIREERVIYVHGTVDPWHTLGITKTKTKNTVSIYINGSSHCANMYPSSPNDSPLLTEARTTINTYLKKWLMEDDLIDSA